MRGFLSTVLVVTLSLLVVLVALYFWPYTLVASPDSTLRVVDDDGKPMAGLRVVREWKTSENRKAEEESVTDASGRVHFERVEFTLNRLHVFTKWLGGFAPVVCGPGSETYGTAEFRVYWPKSYTVHFDIDKWERVNATWVNRDGIHIYDPHGNADPSYAGLYVFNKRDDFQYTLTLSRTQLK